MEQIEIPELQEKESQESNQEDLIQGLDFQDQDLEFELELPIMEFPNLEFEPLGLTDL